MLKKTLFIVGLFLTIGAVIAFLIMTKGAQFNAMAEAAKNAGPPPESVSTFRVEQQVWQERLEAVGSIAPVQGVTIEAEIPGVVQSINFENGQRVEVGDLLVQLDVDVERAQLKAAQASAKLAETELKRSERLIQSGSITQSQLDRAIADYENASANVENLEAVIERKTIQAPFSGKVGIRQINLGQYVAQAASIVSLQANETVFVNFTLPQKALSKISTGMQLSLSSDVYPEQSFAGAITAISPQIDPVTRTVEVQGTLENTQGLLRAGLFVRVSVDLPKKETVIVVPTTAILYAPYGNSIFVVRPAEGQDAQGHIVSQALIRIGEQRGDFVSITKGLELGDEIVSAGAFKLRNGSSVVINNDLAPKPELNPTPDNT